jgi:hypothetical protein
MRSRKETKRGIDLVLLFVLSVILSRPVNGQRTVFRPKSVYGGSVSGFTQSLFGHFRCGVSPWFCLKFPDNSATPPR